MVSNTSETTAVSERVGEILHDFELKRMDSVLEMMDFVLKYGWNLAAARYNRAPEVAFMQKQIYAFYEPEDGSTEICFFGLQVQEYLVRATLVHTCTT